MTNITIASIAAGALAAVTVGLASPAIAAAQDIQIPAAGGAAYSLNAPGDQYDDFGVLGDRGPRTGVQGPGFGAGPDRPVFSPAGEGR
ncbi:hypothetical protein [Mycobacterium sp. ACS4331]|uniref:hypothetical protein n=1 Tax=Mycobacterium sp. ACS4331 TaxID=1834121 RepID=UPI0007FC5057|nr:hypothetical protein [Mycobacterium sp. ACS4331]OBF22585.1 hypothetical protein A5727_07525 [Mycobacterium sp. ACS4331]